MEKKVFRRCFSRLPADPDADLAIAQQVLHLPEYSQAVRIFCFVGMPGEIDTEPLRRALLEDQKEVYVPVSCEHGRMILRQMKSLSDLTGYDRFGIPIPPEDRIEANAGEMDLVLVPGVCFGIDGSRLGRGGGFYDRFLEKFSGISIGLCRQERITGEIPMEPWDQYVDLVVTERNCYRRNRQGV